MKFKVTTIGIILIKKNQEIKKTVRADLLVMLYVKAEVFLLNLLNYCHACSAYKNLIKAASNFWSWKMSKG